MASERRASTETHRGPVRHVARQAGPEGELVALAGALAAPAARWSAAERRVLSQSDGNPDPDQLEAVRRAILRGEDPLGDALCRVRSAEDRRRKGAIYTPQGIVSAMMQWAARHGKPARIVDPGAGSGRFIAAAARRFPDAELIAVENDPVAALLLRANAAVLGIADRLSILIADYRDIDLPRASGPTLFIGNPPYVRHHGIDEAWKDWLVGLAAKYGLRASRLAGLHIHFFLKTRDLARASDFGAFITSAEWLDVNYGAVLRKLLADGMGGAALYVLPARTTPFSDALTTGVITCFQIGRRAATMTVKSVESLDNPEALIGGQAVSRSQLGAAPRWTPFLRRAAGPRPGFVELGEIFAVHRGQVTGANGVWIAGRYSGALPPAYLFPAVTKGRELLSAGPVLSSAAALRRVIDLPAALDGLDAESAAQIREFLRWARRHDAHESYVARHRRAWWSVGLYEPAPILCTYMARRPPAFVLNPCRARHLNIAHGLYPRVPLPEATLASIARWMSANVSTDGGRTYAGGLTKFEPKELERIPIPRPDAIDE